MRSLGCDVRRQRSRKVPEAVETMNVFIIVVGVVGSGLVCLYEGLKIWKRQNYRSFVLKERIPEKELRQAGCYFGKLLTTIGVLAWSQLLHLIVPRDSWWLLYLPIVLVFGAVLYGIKRYCTRT